MPLTNPPTRTPLSAASSGTLTLVASSYSDITGCSLSLTPGNWLVVGAFDFIAAGTDTAGIALGTLVTTGGTATIANSSSLATLALLTGARATAVQSWLVSVTATTTAKLQAQKSAGTGTSTAGNVHTTITAIWAGP